jgi:hypothetical protein
MKMADRLGAAPSELSFGDSAAQGGARPVRYERSAIAALNSPVKLKGPGTFVFPARAISIKNKHLLLACATNPRFHGGCFGVWGHTSSEALNM